VQIRFGTDGIRGPAGSWPLDEDGARGIGAAIARWARVGDEAPLVIVGRDTRESGPALVAAMLEGLSRGGARALDGGVMPTAAVSCAVEAHGAQAGVVITASHNPWRDNGVKVLAPGGGKLLDPDPLEQELRSPGPDHPGGSIEPLADPLGPWLASLPRLDLTGLLLLVDAAHGAASQCAPAALESMGARLVRVGCAPDGRNINDQVGALHPPTELHGAALGICLDGDGDRLTMLVPGHGPLDGDDLLYLLDDGGPVVGTVMSNAGLEAALQGRLIRTPVGDRHVALAMAEHDARVGGEPSGHLILAGGPPTSCGLYTALAVLARHADAQGRPRLPLPVDGWTRWPQARRNVAVRAPTVEVEAASQARAAGMRVLVRASGTEALVRVMVEGRDALLVEEAADRIAAALRDGPPGS